MLEKHNQGVTDAAELFAVAGDVGKDLGLDRRFGGGTEIDVDEADLASDGIEEHGEGIDGLGDITRQRQFEIWHGRSLFRSVAFTGVAWLRALSSAPRSTCRPCLSPDPFGRLQSLASGRMHRPRDLLGRAHYFRTYVAPAK